MENMEVRVRFAPSPTGPLHIGGVRTALFNFLFARKYNGKFILRIEDTDQNRYVEGAEDYIVNSLDWSGIKVDEGVGVGGPYGPYRQSERKEMYRKYAEDLVREGHAYYAFDTTEELEMMRQRLQEAKAESQQYNVSSRNEMKNSLTLPEKEVQEKIASGESYVIRLKLPEDSMVEFYDVVLGHITFHSSQLDDKILFKSDGMPTYHLANVVDDHLMKISHVIRGSEWVNSTPIHILLYRYLGWEDEIPEFAHMPLILKPSGKGKLSKRDGDKEGFPVFPLEWKNPETGEISSGYRESGYFPEAFVNILALLGWNPGDNKEIMDLPEMTDLFSLKKIGKSGARFDPEKARWFNHQYLVKKANSQLARLFMPILEEKGIQTDLSFVEEIVNMVKERVNFVAELWDQSFFFFVAPAGYDAKVVKKRWKEDTPGMMKDIMERLSTLESFEEAVIEKSVKSYIEEKELGFGKVLNALRLCIVGSGMGPGLFKIIEMIGKEESLHRIDKAIQEIKR
ncbi:MAG: glutamate--tRNA ligase [Bacteroidales bacterium]|nr:glutamate--tRNA ligase [Bacteroidales bacterium]MCF8386440.1 glutamate--tRNA ligase [Bacteroidales bacterium]MCF8397816.1 glutamate--tRNA ligase [Bacteroidales bacterium]